MFEIVEGSLPFVRTRRALLAVDLQNDFISPDAVIPVSHPPDFVENIVNLATSFRRFGNVIWVRSIFEASRSVNDDGESESVITDAELPKKSSKGPESSNVKIRPFGERMARFTKIVEDSYESSEEDEAADAMLRDEQDHISETYLTLKSGQPPHVVSQSSPGSNFLSVVARCLDTRVDLIFQKSYYSAFKDGRLVQVLRAKFVTEIYLCGSLTNISVFATAMDAARHGYTITIVDDCSGYRSKARHDEALRKLVESTGCAIISSSDLIHGIRDSEPRTASTQRPPSRQNTGVRGGKEEKSKGLDSLMARLDLSPDDSEKMRHSDSPSEKAKSISAAEIRGAFESPTAIGAGEDLKLPARVPNPDVKSNRVKTKIRSRRRLSKSGAKDAFVGEASGSSPVAGKVVSAATPESLTDTSQSSGKRPVSSNQSITASSTPNISTESLGSATSVDVDEVNATPGRRKEKTQDEVIAADLDDEIEQMARMSVTDEGSNLCEGDTTIIQDLLDTKLADNIFEWVRDEVSWQKMSHQGGDVPRLVAVQGQIGEDGSIPIYRHPADESLPLLQFSPTVSQIQKKVEEQLGHSVNHVLIQFYRDGNDYISEHSDKTLDIAPDTFIGNVSLGAQRTMVFRTKKSQKPVDTSQDVHSRQAIRAPLPHNSMCRMGLMTNMRWLHGVRQDKRLDREKSAEEQAYSGGRISLTFRRIGTFLSKDQTRIWGQGATSKSKAGAKTVINGENAEAEKMIRAFGKENHESNFEWKEQYGEGFDVLHIENSPKLFLSGGTISDMRVKVMLEVYRVKYGERELSGFLRGKDATSGKEALPIPELLPVRFMDNDVGKSVVVGDMAIMLYLEAVYGPKPTEPTSSQALLARSFTRFQQSSDLLRIWRTQPSDSISFQKELSVWDAFATEGPFIAGETISLADYAIWPLLDDIQRQTAWKTFDGLEKLAAYHQRLKESAPFTKVSDRIDTKEVTKLHVGKSEVPELKEAPTLGPNDQSEGKKKVKKGGHKSGAKGKKAA